MSTWHDGTSGIKTQALLENRIPYEHVSWWGASPDASSAANTAAIQDAYDFVHINGGVVFWGPGTYDVDDEITFYANTSTKGSGKGEITRVRWSSDLGSGKFGFKCDAATNDRVEVTFEGIKAEGPVTDGVDPGDVGALMHGFDTRARMRFVRVDAEGFWAGWHVINDHISWISCDAAANFFNVYYADGGASHGDHSYTDCDFSSAWMASFGFHPSNGMDGNNVRGVHVGDAPWAFAREAGTPTFGFLLNTDFTDLNAEGMGNGFINGPNTAGEGDQIKFCNFNVFGITMDPELDPDLGGNRIDGTDSTEQIRCGSFQKNRFLGNGIFSDNPVPTECFIRIVGADASFSGNEFTILGSAVIDNLSSTVAFVRAVNVYGGNKFDTGNYSGLIVHANNDFAIGEVVGYDGFEAQGIDVGEPAMGVSVAAVTHADGACALVAQRGVFDIRVNSSVNWGEVAYPDQANLGYGAAVSAADWATAPMPPIGVWADSGSSGLQTCHLTFGA